MLSLLRAFPYFWTPVLINENYENDFFNFEIDFSKFFSVFENVTIFLLNSEKTHFDKI